MVDFVNEIPDASEPASTFPTTVSSAFTRSFSNASTMDNYLPPVGHTPFNDHQQQIAAEVPTQSFMSLGQLSSDYATYLLLNQFVFDNKAIMAVTEFQKAFPLPIGAQNPSNSLSSLLPYANMLSFMSGFDTTNLLGNLQLLQTAANMMATIEQQQLQTQRQVLPTFGGPSSAATCASSVIAPSESPNEANNNFVKQQFSSPSSSPPFNLDESLQNSISKNKLGRSYNPGRPLAMADRERILNLYKKGYKISHIGRLLGVTHSCVSKIMTRYRRTGSMCPRSAQVPRKISSNSSPTRSSTSPFSNTEASSIFSSVELSDSASSTCSFLPNVMPQSTTSSLLFNGIPSTSSSVTTTSSSPLLIKPVPVKIESIYCTSN